MVCNYSCLWVRLFGIDSEFGNKLKVNDTLALKWRFANMNHSVKLVQFISFTCKDVKALTENRWIVVSIDSHKSLTFTKSWKISYAQFLLMFFCSKWMKVNIVATVRGPQLMCYGIIGRTIFNSITLFKLFDILGVIASRYIKIVPFCK